MASRAVISVLASVSFVGLAACGGSTESSAPVPGSDTTIGSEITVASTGSDPAVSTTEAPGADPTESVPATDPPVTDPPVTDAAGHRAAGHRTAGAGDQ